MLIQETSMICCSLCWIFNPISHSPGFYRLTLAFSLEHCDEFRWRCVATKTWWRLSRIKRQLHASFTHPALPSICIVRMRPIFCFLTSHCCVRSILYALYCLCFVHAILNDAIPATSFSLIQSFSIVKSNLNIQFASVRSVRDFSYACAIQ